VAQKTACEPPASGGNGYISLEAARQLFPAVDGHLPSRATLHRYCTVGCRDIKLSARRLAGRWITTEQDVRAFLDAIASEGDEAEDLAARIAAAERAVAARERERAQVKEERDQLRRSLLLP
jgi:hypothetical protein